MNALFDFIGGTDGPWQVIEINNVKGETLERVSHIKIEPSSTSKFNPGVWTLKGVRSNLRYTEKDEQEKLVAIQPDLGRPESNRAALIPIRKSEAWWSLTQNERREIFEKQSNHIQTGLQYLPAIARRLFHCRDLDEPFDFLTWFEYADADSDAFEHLLTALRKTPEWKYVEREVDIRLVKIKF